MAYVLVAIAEFLYFIAGLFTSLYRVIFRKGPPATENMAAATDAVSAVAAGLLAVLIAIALILALLRKIFG